MRSSGGTNLALVLSVVARTNSDIAFFAAPSFHEGRGSVCGMACVLKARPATIATTEANRRRTYDFMEVRQCPPGETNGVAALKPCIGVTDHPGRCRGHPSSRGGEYMYPTIPRNRCRQSLSGVPTPALDLIHYLREVVTRGGLHRRECLERFEPIQPKLLTDGQHVPVVYEGGRRRRKCAADTHRALLVDADSLLEWVTSNVLDQCEVERDERHDPTLCARLGHRVVHLP